MVTGGFRSVLYLSVFQRSLLLNFRVGVFSRFWSFSSRFFYLLTKTWQVEIPKETQIWEGENESIRPRQRLILQLPVVITFFIWQARIGSYGNGLIDVEEKPHILKRF